jgi:hypothetical protein
MAAFGIVVEGSLPIGSKRRSAVKPFRLLIPVVAVCLLLVLVRNSRSAVQGQVPDAAPPRAQAQLDAPLIPAYFLYHPRFYKEYGSEGLNSTVYVQNPQPFPPMNVVLEFYRCDSGALVLIPAPWTILPRETRVAGPSNFPDLAPGCYGLVMSSDVDLTYASVVEDTWSAGSATDKLATHTGFAREDAHSGLRFGPFLKGDVNSTVVIWNAFSYGAEAAMTASAYTASGAQIDLPLCTVAPFGQCTYDASSLAELTAPFTGTLVIQSAYSSVGIMALGSTTGDVNEYRTPLETNATAACLPRVLKHVNEGGVKRSTNVFVANSTDAVAHATVVFYGSNGIPVENAGQDFYLAANGSQYLKLTEMDDLPSGIWSVCASGDRALAMEELTLQDSPLTSPTSSATHGVTKLGSSDSLAVTHLMRSGASYTAFSVQNTGIVAADIDLEYYDVAGTLVYSDSVNLPPMGWARFDQSTQSELENGFVGSPVLSSNQPLVSLVDDYVPPTPSHVYLPLVPRG